MQGLLGRQKHPSPRLEWRRRGKRPARPGEVCVCGEQAVTVFADKDFGEIGSCGHAPKQRVGACQFCGFFGLHDGICPHYRIRPEWAHEEYVAELVAAGFEPRRISNERSNAVVRSA